MRMLFSRKGDLTLNVIVVAALVLIVLVVMVMIFTGSMGKWVANLRGAEEGKTCGNYGGLAYKGLLCPAGTTQVFASISWGELQKGCVCCKGDANPPVPADCEMGTS